jgi:hypothetical protein
MVFNDIFNNISVILWQSVLLVEETKVDQSKVKLACDTFTLDGQTD